MTDLSAFTRVEITAKDSTGPAFSSAKANIAGLGSGVVALQDTIKRLALTFGSIGAAIAIIDRMTSSVQRSIEAAAALNDLASATGSTVESLSRLRNQAAIAGTDFEAFAALLLKLGVGMASASDETTAVGRALQALGVQSRDPAAALQEIIQKLSQYSDGVRKLAIARDLFGKSGPEFVAALKNMADMQDVAATVTARQAAEAELLGQQLRQLKVEATGFADAILSAVVPAVNDFLARWRMARKEGVGIFTSFDFAGTYDSSIVERVTKATAEVARLRDFYEKAASKPAYAHFATTILRDLEQAQKELKVLIGMRDMWISQGVSRLGYIGDARDQRVGNGAASVSPPPQLNYSSISGPPKKEVSEYEKQIERVERMATDADVALRQMFSTEEITAAQKALEELMASSAWDKLSDREQAILQIRLGNIAGLQEWTSWAGKAAKAAGEFAEAQRKERDEWEAGGRKRVEDLEDLVDALDLEAKYIGYSNTARERSIALAKAQQLFDQGHIKTVEDLIATKDRLIGAFNRRDDLAAEQAQLDEFKRTVEEINSALSGGITDALMRGFEGGKDLAQNFVDTLRNMFKTLVLRPVVQMALAPVAGGIAGLMMPGTANAMGLAGNGLLSAGGLFTNGATALENLFGLGGTSYAAGTNAFGVGVDAMGLGIKSGALAFEQGAAAAGSSMAGGASLASMVPYIGWGLAAAAIGYSLFGGKGGGPKAGGFGTTGIDLATGLLGSGSTYRLVTPADADLQMQALAQTNATSYLGLYRGLGGRGMGSATFTNAFDRDPNGTADSRTSFQVWMPGSANPVYQALDRGAGRTDQELAAALALESKRAIFAALQASLDGVPKYISDLFAGIDAATASGETIDRIEAMAAAVKTAAETMAGLRAQFEAMSGSDVSALVDALGGVQAFAQSIAYLGANFQTDGERLAQATAGLNDGFAALGMAVPKTHQDFLALLSSFDLTTESGRGAYAAVMSLSSSFVAVKGTAEQAAQAMAELTRSGEQFYLENFASQEERTQGLWRTIQQAWTEFGGRVLEMTQGAFDHIPVTAEGIQALRDALYNVEGGAEVFNSIMRDAGQAIVDMNGSLATTVTKAEEVAQAVDNMFGGVNIGAGGVLSGAYGAVARIIGQGQAAADGSTQDLGGRIATQMAYLQQQIGDENLRWAAQWATGMTDQWDRITHDIIAGGLNQENTRLAAELARYTTLTAQYDGARAEQLVELEQWYDQQQKALQGNAGALALLAQTFQERWDAIVAGTAGGVDGTLSELERLQQSLLEYVARLKIGDLSPLSPAERLRQAASTFYGSADLARAGDLTAMGNLTSFADDYLRLAREAYASSSMYTATFREVTDLLTAIGTGNSTTPQDAAMGALAKALPSSSPLTSQADTAALGEKLDRLETTVAELLAEIASKAGTTAAATQQTATAVQAQTDALIANTRN